MKYIEKQIVTGISKNLSLKDKFIMRILKRYTYIIYKIGFDDGFYFKE